MTYLLYDKTTHRTVGVIRGDSMDANVYPADAKGWAMTGLAYAARNKVVAVTTNLSYTDALRKFKKHKPGDPDLITYQKAAGNKHWKRLTGEQQQTILKLSDAGHSNVAIARRVGVTEGTVRNVVKRHLR